MRYAELDHTLTNLLTVLPFRYLALEHGLVFRDIHQRSALEKLSVKFVLNSFLRSWRCNEVESPAIYETENGNVGNNCLVR